MSSEELRQRDNWQTPSGEMAKKSEEILYAIFEELFKTSSYSKYILHRRPKHLKDIYSRVSLKKEELINIYDPKISIEKMKWGIIPDFAIENTLSKKIIFGEIKRQDGWVEGKEISAGIGNAHERMCKLFSPGLMQEMRKVGNIQSEDILPFWVIFCGDITRDPKRVREISLWFGSFEYNYFMFRANRSKEELISHFDLYLKSHLD